MRLVLLRARCDRTKDISKRHLVLCISSTQIHQRTLHKDTGRIFHNEVHGTYSKLRNIFVSLNIFNLDTEKASSAKKINKSFHLQTTLPFGAVSILIANRASNRARPRQATDLNIHTWRTDFPAGWTITEAIYLCQCHPSLPVDDEARSKKQGSENCFHRGAIKCR
jgi:hypothetical protein